MLAATVKIGSKNFVQVEILQAIKTRLDHLPAKQKTMLEFKDAAAFLYSGIKNAVQKNYSKDEIQQIIIKEGWSITQNSFRYLWSLFLSEDEKPSKKRTYVRSGGKTKTPKSNSPIETIESNIADKENVVISQDSLSSEIHTSSKDNAFSYKTNPISDAHFNITPDTEDL